MKKLLLVWTLVLLGTSTLLAQRTVRGTITDANGEALFGASVLVKGTFTGTVTDIDGAYEVSMPDGASTLVFSYTGYTTQEVEVGASNVLDVVLQEGVTLEAAVVTALGIQREEKAIGYAVQKVDGDDVVGADLGDVLDLGGDVAEQLAV